MDKAPGFELGDCRFDPCLGRSFLGWSLVVNESNMILLKHSKYAAQEIILRCGTEASLFLWVIFVAYQTYEFNDRSPYEAHHRLNQFH